jgi:IPT/TIG domain-containing protein
MPSRSTPRSLVLVILASLALPGCSAINPLCGSSRPSPVLTSIKPTTVTDAQVQATFTLNLTGSHFVAASIVKINNVQVATNVTSSTTIKATVGPATISGPGSFNVWVSTPAGNSGNLGCDSGGNSSQAALTVQ